MVLADKAGVVNCAPVNTAVPPLATVYQLYTAEGSPEDAVKVAVWPADIFADGGVTEIEAGAVPTVTGNAVLEAETQPLFDASA